MLPYIIVTIIIMLFLSRSLKLSAKQERYAVVALGEFKEFKGPGVLFKFSGCETAWVKLRLGDQGDLVSSEFGRFHDKDIPISVDSGTKIGSKIKMIGFNDNAVLAHLDIDQRRTFICEKCGHENII